ncbi:hypothetical protein CROQUDRAFT_526215 [Cronartium quercuum f. sp. fusiforme G11]|uniref:Uncharacterized protein n=1 Tax=Cronartium quercuum f. sp. fusiforme G11 TaxID=708437 RepID=A0A9P6N4Y2_9BASI|nr:hypothetical protein CROQUDRAFT_526215 [Cronartium quercuum f. sp. fusiforme G11]
MVKLRGTHKPNTNSGYKGKRYDPNYKRQYGTKDNNNNEKGKGKEKEKEEDM